MKKSNQDGRSVIAMLVITAFLASGAIAGCSNASQDEPAVTPAVDSARPDTTAEVDAAPTTQTPKTLPDGYPRDAAPIYEPSTITHAFKMGSGQALKYMIVVEIDGSVDAVAQALADYYKGLDARVNQTALNEKGVGQLVVSKNGYGIIMTYSAGKKSDTTSVNYDVHQQRGAR